MDQKGKNGDREVVMRWLTEFSLEKAVCWPGIVAVMLQESGLDLEILWE